jgi:hypothetical protein
MGVCPAGNALRGGKSLNVTNGPTSKSPEAARSSRELAGDQPTERRGRERTPSAEGRPEAQAQAAQPDDIGDELTPTEQGQ